MSIKNPYYDLRREITRTLVLKFLMYIYEIECAEDLTIQILHD